MLLDDPSSVARDELFKALGRITPSEVAATAVARTLEKEGKRASRTLRAMGSIAEKPVLEVLRGSDPKAVLWRAESSRRSAVARASRPWSR